MAEAACDEMITRDRGNAAREPPRQAGDHLLKIVSSLDELLRLPRDQRVNGFGARQPIQLDISNLPRHGQIRAQRLLNRLQSRCGCAAGAVALLLSLAVGAVHIYARNVGSLSWRLLPQVAAVLLAALLIGFAAKMLTLVVTRWQFACECRVQHHALVRLHRNANRETCNDV